MHLLFVMLLSFFAIGCLFEPPLEPVPAADAAPDPNDPDSISRWESSEYNVFKSKVRVVEFKFFHGTLGDSKPKQPQKMAVYVFEALDGGIKPEQQAAMEWLVENEAELHAAAREAIYRFYQKTYPAYHEGMSIGAALYGGRDEIAELLPKIVSGKELDQRLQFHEVYIHPPVDGKASVGIYCNAPWDEEHGIGLRLQEPSNVTAGLGDHAFHFADR